MSAYNQQIIRIRAKLRKAKAADPHLKTFGAEKHKYILGKPCTTEEVSAFETKYGITLPECYKAFVLNIGNGGSSYLKAGAGPYYGIYGLGTNVNDFAAEEYLQAPCVLFPDMKKPFWDELISRTDDANDSAITEAEYDQEIGKIFGGLLPIVSQGCTYANGLVLNGPHRGRVVNLDLDLQMPSFTYENNFLDWYERWLDEVISGQLMGSGASWFGYNMGGPEETLINTYRSSPLEETRLNVLHGLLAKPNLSESTLAFVELELGTATQALKKTCLTILTRSDYHRAKKYLESWPVTDLRTVSDLVYYYARGYSKDWAPRILEHVHLANDPETFDSYCKLLEISSTDYWDALLPFTKHADPKLRSRALLALRLLKEKDGYVDVFIAGLNDEHADVVNAALNGLYHVNDPKTLPSLKKVAEKYPAGPDYLVNNLNFVLKGFSGPPATIRTTDRNGSNETTAIQSKKKWYEFWKR